jgi:benzoylformate decarboxylase
MSAENCTNRNQRRGAAVLLEVLRSEGARYVFGNPGTTELPLIDALVDAPDISYPALEAAISSGAPNLIEIPISPS